MFKKQLFGLAVGGIFGFGVAILFFKPWASDPTVFNRASFEHIIDDTGENVGVSFHCTLKPGSESIYLREWYVVFSDTNNDTAFLAPKYGKISRKAEAFYFTKNGLAYSDRAIKTRDDAYKAGDFTTPNSGYTNNKQWIVSNGTGAYGNALDAFQSYDGFTYFDCKSVSFDDIKDSYNEALKLALYNTDK